VYIFNQKIKINISSQVTVLRYIQTCEQAKLKVTLNVISHTHLTLQKHSRRHKHR